MGNNLKAVNGCRGLAFIRTLGLKSVIIKIDILQSQSNKNKPLNHLGT